MNKQNRILKKLKQVIKNFFRSRNIEFYRRVSKSRILEAITLLKPNELGYPLIRIVAKGDGAYLIPDLLDEIKYCFSPGVGQISEFEAQIKKRGIKSFLADYTVEGPASEDLFDFKTTLSISLF